MSEPKHPASGDKWRDKYVELVKEVEEEEAKFNLTSASFRQLLSLTSLAASGQHDDLDRALIPVKELPSQIHTDALAASIQQLQSAIREFDNSFQQDRARVTAKIKVMAKPLADAYDSRHSDTHSIKALRELQKSVTSDLESWSGYLSQLEGWVDVFNHFLAPQTESGSRQSEPLVDPQSRGKICKMLESVFAQLAIPEKLLNRAQQVQDALAHASDSEFPKAITDSAFFLVDCMHSSHEEFEEFLKSLDKRLAVIKDIVSKTTNTEEERKHARNRFENHVENQIGELRTAVDDLGDIGDLGASIQSHLLKILSSIQEYNSNESEREERLQAELKDMEQRLNDMEEESKRARETIEKQQHEANTDHLTQLPNRAAYDKRLALELNNKATKGTSLSLVVCDIDHFKKINDTYGHLIGDKVLKLIAKVLKQSLGQEDFLARFGGEEFVLLAPKTSVTNVMKLAEKMRLSIERCPFRFSGKGVTITMSFGVTEIQADEAISAAFERADKALYQAKEEGRNRCVLA